ncbi:MAG: hypothetical protein OEL89_02140 [Candidatus Peregrinibacteria bacterium]|nr:hypothetical protein [Candidatus Peregrinibacteria bacterium]
MAIFFSTSIHVSERAYVTGLQRKYSKKVQSLKQLFHKKEYEKIILLTEDVLDKLPCNQTRCLLSYQKKELYLILAKAQKELGKIKDAIKTYQKLIDFIPRNYKFYYAKAELEYQLGFWEKSLDNLNQALEVYPDFAPAVELRFVILEKYTTLEKLTEAKKDYEERKKFTKNIPLDLYYASGKKEFKESWKLSLGSAVIDGQFHNYRQKLDFKKDAIETTDILSNLRLDIGADPISFTMRRIILYKNNEKIQEITDFSAWKTQNLIFTNQGIENVFEGVGENPFISNNISQNLETFNTIEIELKIDSVSGRKIKNNE